MAIDYSHAQMGTQRAMELGSSVTKAVDHRDLMDQSMNRERLRRELMQGQQFAQPQMMMQDQGQGGGGFYGGQGGGQQAGNPGTRSSVHKIRQAVRDEMMSHDGQPRRQPTSRTRGEPTEPSMTDRIEDHQDREGSPTHTPADQQRRIYRDLVTGRVKMGGGSQ